MALCRFGQGIVSMRGTLGGIHFKRDKSGNHCCGPPRKVRQRTAAQHKQRGAFSTARAFSKINRTVSYNIYLALNDLPMAEPPQDYQIPHLQEPPE